MNSSTNLSQVEEPPKTQNPLFGTNVEDMVKENIAIAEMLKKPAGTRTIRECDIIVDYL